MKLVLLAAAVLACMILAGCTATAPPGASTSDSTPATSTAVAAATSSTPSASSRPATSTRTTSPAGCDVTLWHHVYHPYRLHIISQCKTITGTVDSIKHEPDGDLHIDLKPDNPSLVNAVNDRIQHGDLVLEAICWGTVTQADAVPACQGVTDRVTVPQAGERVRVTGSYVLDADHGWMEIHPVSKITVTGHAAVATPAPSSPAPATTAAAAGCYPKTPSGGCYEPGEFCSKADHGETGVAGDGKTILCRDIGYTTWHWEAA